VIAPQNRLTDVLIALATLGAMISSCVHAAIVLWPPIDAGGHVVMPVGQTFNGIVVGSIVGLVLAWLLRPRAPAERTFARIALHVLMVFAIVSVARQ
jgi:hypothetical protein